MQREELEALAGEVALLIKAALTPVLARMTALESRDVVPGPRGESGPTGPAGDLGPAGQNGLDGVAGRDGRDGLPGVPGATGEKGLNGIDGRHGTDGTHGKDGADGLGLEDLSVDFDGDRTVLFRFERGDLKKVFAVPLPFQKYQGAYQAGHTYVPGDTVTWAGSVWHCEEATIRKPGDGTDAWKLAVKSGRDGRDGRDAPGTLPVVKVR